MQNESDKHLDELVQIAQEQNMGYDKPVFPRWTGWLWCGIVLWPLIGLWICWD